MENRPLITVITAAYHSRYLYEAINSVLSQTYPRIEYIVTDDGTGGFDKEGVERYIEKNKKSNIVDFRVIHHVENLGTVRNMNIAMKACQGEYIFNLSADDVFADDCVLEDWVGDMFRRQSDLSVGCFGKYNEDFSEALYTFPFEYQKELLRSGSSKHIFQELTIANFVYGCSTARSRRCLEKYGFYDEEYCLVEDYPYVLSYIRRGGTLDFFDQVCIKYRQGGSSSSKRFNTVYERDSDLIFQREILPYTKCKIIYKLQYLQWKKNQKTNFWEEISTANKRGKIFLYLKNPVQFCISFKQAILKQKCKALKRR